MVANETNMAGMPRVGSSLSYVSYASVYATPVVPLPKNYSYSNIPTSWREHTTDSQERVDYSVHAGSVGSSKGKEPEYIQPSVPVVLAPRLSPTQPSSVSSKGASPNGSPGNSSGSDDELEIGSKIMSHHPQGLSYQPSLSQQSTSSSERSFRMPLASIRTTVEVPTKTGRHYPPQAQSSYFSAPRPMTRRAFSVDTSIPPISTVTERASSTASSSTSDNFSTASSITSIGVAIAPPIPPYPMSPAPISSTGEDYVVSEQSPSKAATTSITPVQAHRRFSAAERHSVSADITATWSNGQSIMPPSPAQKQRRRLSKSRPSNSDDSGDKISIETARLAVPVTAETTVTASDLSQIGSAVRQEAYEPSLASAVESVRKGPKKLCKNPEAKSSQRGRWTFRVGNKTPAIAAH